MMDAWTNSFLLVALGEMGDKTQLLSLLLTTRYKRPWTILLGVFIATLLNHGLASGLGAAAATLFPRETLTWILAATFFGFGIWILIPDKEEEPRASSGFGVLMTTIVAFFIAEMGDKTQLATIALGAQYSDPLSVTIGTTLGMLASNALAVFVGPKLLEKVPMKWVRIAASLLFFAFGISLLLHGLS